MAVGATGVARAAGESQPATTTAPGAAAAAEPTKQELLQQINALKAQVDKLQARQQASEQANDARNVAATADALMRDAKQHSQLLDVEGFTAGYTSDKGFVLKTTDNKFLLHPWFQLQFRNVTNFREDSKQKGTTDDTQNGFEVRRMKFGFDGNVFSPDLTYLFLWATDRKSGSPVLEEAWAKYKFTDSPFAIKGGQMKDPLWHEQIASSKYQLSVERSYLTDIFANGDAFVQAATLIYDNGGALRAEGGITDGLRSANTNFQDFPTNTADWGAVARVEYKVFGNWKDYDRMTAFGDKESVLVIGAGADYTEAGDTGQLTHAVDIMYKTPNQLAVYGGYLGRYNRHNQGSPGSNGGSTAATPIANTYDYGFEGQLSYQIDQHWEPYIRYEYIQFDGDGLPAGSTTTVHEISAGFNYYLHGHAAKFTADVVYLPNGAPVSDDGSGVLSTGKDKNELLLRAQFQLLL
jgi:hypothetical protein